MGSASHETLESAHVSPSPPPYPGPPFASSKGYMGGLLTPLPASARLGVYSHRSRDNSLKTQVTPSPRLCLCSDPPNSKSKPWIPLPLRPLLPHPSSDSLASIPQAPGPSSLRVQVLLCPSARLFSRMCLACLCSAVTFSPPSYFNRCPHPSLPCLSLTPYPPHLLSLSNGNIICFRYFQSLTTMIKFQNVRMSPIPTHLSWTWVGA